MFQNLRDEIGSLIKSLNQAIHNLDMAIGEYTRNPCASTLGNMERARAAVRRLKEQSTALRARVQKNRAQA